MLFLLRFCNSASKVVALCLLLSVIQNFAFGQEKGTMRIDVGMGALSFIDINNGSDMPLLSPLKLGGLFSPNKSVRINAPMVSFTKYFRHGLAWYASCDFDYALLRSDPPPYKSQTIENIFCAGIWGGLEFNHIRTKFFSLSTRLGLGILGRISNSKTLPPKVPNNTIYPDDDLVVSSYPTNGIWYFPAIEFQPFNVRFGQSHAAYLNINLGTTGLVQLGYSKRF